MYSNYIKDLKPIRLELGQIYTIILDDENPKYLMVKLIKTTKKGYNFLNLETSKCLCKNHIYPSKCSNHTHNNETWFWLPINLNIK